MRGHRGVTDFGEINRAFSFNQTLPICSLQFSQRFFFPLIMSIARLTGGH